MASARLGIMGSNRGSVTAFQASSCIDANHDRLACLPGWPVEFNFCSWFKPQVSPALFRAEQDLLGPFLDRVSAYLKRPDPGTRLSLQRAHHLVTPFW